MLNFFFQIRNFHVSHNRLDLRLLLGRCLWLLLLYWLLRRSITVQWWSELWLLLYRRSITVQWWSELLLLLYWRAITVQRWSELLLRGSI